MYEASGDLRRSLARSGRLDEGASSHEVDYGACSDLASAQAVMPKPVGLAGPEMGLKELKSSLHKQKRVSPRVPSVRTTGNRQTADSSSVKTLAKG